MATGDNSTRALEAADQIDQAARLLAVADVMLGDPAYVLADVERQLLNALGLVLNALAILRGHASPRVV
jgi:hypothetical protein